MIFETVYKDRPAIGVKSDRLTALFLPQDGGKMASLCDETGFEYLFQRPDPQYKTLAYDGDFAQAECSGFDDMFPTIDPYTPSQGEYVGVEYPDHGEWCRLDLGGEQEGDAFRMRYRSRRFAVSGTKTVRAEHGRIAIDYEFFNHGQEDFLYLWAGHCLLKGFEDGRVVCGYAEDAPIEVMFNRPQGRRLSRTQLAPRADRALYKYYFSEKAPQGYCGYHYPSHGGRTLLLQYDPAEVPYLGIWLSSRGFNDMYSVALEPCTAPFDRPDIPMERGMHSVLPKGAAKRFTVYVALEG